MSVYAHGDKEAAKLCKEKGHAFREPVVVRQGPYIFFGRVEGAVSVCRRCGACVVSGWIGREEER